MYRRTRVGVARYAAKNTRQERGMDKAKGVRDCLAITEGRAVKCCSPPPNRGSFIVSRIAEICRPGGEPQSSCRKDLRYLPCVLPYRI